MRIPAKVGVLVVSTWRENTSTYAVAGLVYPKEGHAYTLLVSHRVARDTMYCYESVNQVSSQGKMIYFKLKRLVQRGFFVPSYCPVGKNK